MSSGSSLLLLKEKRNNFLRAEVGVLLHNLGKLSRAFLAHERCLACKQLGLSLAASDKEYEDFDYDSIAGLVAEYITNPDTKLTKAERERLEPNAAVWLEPATNNLLPENFRHLLQQKSIHLPAPLDDRTYAIGDFIEFQDKKWYEPKQSGPRILVIFPGGSKATELVEISHHAASGVEKEGIPSGLGLQFQEPIYRATVFGFETSVDENKIESTRAKVIDAVSILDRTEIWKAVEEPFIMGVGDTRRPINDVSLWDLSASTAAFYKAAIAKLVFDKIWTSRGAFKWRLLHIGFDGLSFLERSPTIGDLLGRQAALQAALDDVKKLLEETYPLGNEIYRDENGSAFVVPDLDGDDTEGNRLRGLIETHILDTLKNSELGGELRPRIHIIEAHEQAAGLHEVLNSPPPVLPFKESLDYWWRGETADICTACGLRPQGWGAPDDSQRRKAQQRSICYVCLERRGKRAREWARARHRSGGDRELWERTIWLDEVADENGRLALVVGKFDLSQWLNGEMIQTLLVAYNPASNDSSKRYIPKNPSFARIQRVWRTTQQFWQEVQEKDIPAVIGLRQQRLSIAVKNADELRGRLGDFHAYEAEIENRRLAVLWDGESGRLLTADNLTVWTKNGKPLAVQLPEELPLFEPGGYGQRRVRLVTAIIDKARLEEIPEIYTPMIPLQAQPVSFTALVPANRALDLATKISQRYELEIGKVCNRLPILLGLVFFDRRQSLFSVLDTGRRLLKQPFSEIECTVASSSRCSRRNGDSLPEYLEHPHFCEWQELKLTTTKDETIYWRAATVMGDGVTPDDWYPYVNVLRDAKGSPPSGRRQFSHQGKQWVHVSEVKNGDVICFMPSYFTWLHLDTSARRFEAGQKIQCLGELAGLTKIWSKLQQLVETKGLTENQLQGIITLLIMKGKEWGVDSEQYRQLAEALIYKEGLDGLTVTDLISGRLEAAFYLYHRLCRRKLRGE
jgi:hypothetical protein